MTPRLVTTAEALSYLGGRHPSELGLKPIGNGRGQRWDLRAIDAKLDRLSELVTDAPQGAANDDDSDELRSIREKLGAPEGV